jgi:hypothetical protein
MKGKRGLSFPRPEHLATTEMPAHELDLLKLDFDLRRRRPAQTPSANRPPTIREKIARWLEEKL